MLNAGSSWAAFQVGALRHLVGDRGLAFDVHVGTGIGAVHAAFAACGELDALADAWQRMGLRRLVRPNLRRPWVAPMVATPQRRFVAAHVTESRLAARGTVVAAAVVDLRTGRVEHLVWPGCDVPIVDGLMAAVATPGLLAPLPHGDRVLAEATIVDAVPLAAVLDGHLPGVDPVDEVVAVLASPSAARRRYATWRAVADRAVAVNLARDTDAAVDDAARGEAATAAFGRVDRELPAALAALVDDPAVRERLVAEVDRRRAAAAAAHPGRPRHPRTLVVRPTGELAYPLWRFRDGDLADAYLQGHAAARAVLDAAGGPG